MKKHILIPVLAIVAILMIGTSFIVTAASNSDRRNPAEIIAGLTGKSTQEVREERREGTCFAAQAQEAGVLPEFQEERLALCEERLDSAVADGSITQEDADQILAEVKLRQENFAATGLCQGNPQGNPQGYYQGNPCGPVNGLRDGTCIGQENPNGPGNGPKDGTGKGTGTCIGCEAIDTD